MIIAPIQDRTLRGIVTRAALPEEDVFHGEEDVREALHFGHPRLLVCRMEDQQRVLTQFDPGHHRVPVLTLADRTLRGWRSEWAADGLAVNQVDDAALRLRCLMSEAARKAEWVESVYADLVQTVGRGLPKEFRGFSRRVFESPVRYSTLRSVGEPFGLSAGALKARFRRRGLPSPHQHLSWFRLLAASRVLSDPSETTLSASYRMGFRSDGNFCRWVSSTSGLTPSDLREWNGRLLLLVRMAERFLSVEHLDAWESFRGVFLRQVA